ncbi:MAG: hypothetical protein K1X82_06060 [Bacteroidia bacterium]|nr:hypothetical protein [Bacteroidia bacterium]
MKIRLKFTIDNDLVKEVGYFIKLKRNYMVNVYSGKIKLVLLILLLIVGFSLFMVRSIYTSQKGIDHEQSVMLVEKIELMV